MFRWILLLLFTALAAYEIGQLDSWIRIALAGSSVCTALRILSAFAVIVLSLIPLLTQTKLGREDALPRDLLLIGNLWLGILMAGGVLLLLMQLGALVYRHVSGSVIRPAAAGVVLLAVLILISAIIGYGFYNARRITVKTYTVDLTEASSSGRHGQMTAVLVGDLHISSNTTVRQIRKIVTRINREDPDVVLFAGDYFSSTMHGIEDEAGYIKALRGIRAPQGVYGVYGNHDVEEPILFGFSLQKKEDSRRSPRMTRFVERAGITILDDDSAELEDGAIRLIGRIDGETSGTDKKGRKSAQELLSGSEPETPVIVLEHEPFDLDELGKSGADLILSGHTHGGQIFPGNYIIRLFNENSYGRKKAAGAVSIVTSGAGCYGPPIRIGSRSEIVTLHIRY
ncbi:MAG: metallophosphoesterase [Anaerovoracaceae bacterium]